MVKKLNGKNKTDQFSGIPGDGSLDSEFEIQDWMRGHVRNNSDNYTGLCLASPVDGVSLIGFVKYLEHEKWKQRRMRR